MRLDDLCKKEVTILVAIIALARELPGEIWDYTEALGELRRKHFRIKSSGHRDRRSVAAVDAHTIRATAMGGLRQR